MIQIDINSKTYTCPFCGHAQAYNNSYELIQTGGVCYHFVDHSLPPVEIGTENSLDIYTLKCNNNNCKKISVTTINRKDGKQKDIIPEVVLNQYPDYIPEQIRKDYEEACLIIEASPKAAATLLRRCLQGMIHDFWGIHEKNLNAEITKLKEKVTSSQWNAIDGLRKLGNIGAHMESDVNLIIDIDQDEAKKLLKLIELLLEQWYIARHNDEKLYKDITYIADEKEAKR